MTMHKPGRKTRAAALAFAAGMGAAAPAWSLDLAQVYRLALEQDSTIRASRAQAQAGRERLPQARAQFFPNISISSTRGRNELESTVANVFGQAQTSESRYSSSNDVLSVRQPLFRKQLTAQYRQAQALVADSEAVLDRDQQNLVIRTTQAYFETLLSEEQLVLVGIQKRSFETQVDAARKGFAAGSGTRTDIDEAQARLDLITAQELEARQNVDLSRRQLEVLINRPLVEPVAPIDVSKLALTPPEPASVEAWTAIAEASSPEIRSANAQVAAARAEVDRVSAGHWPTLDAVAQISRSNSDSVNQVGSLYKQKQIALQLSVPIFQGGLVNSQVREAVAMVERAENKLEELRRDLGVRIHREFRGVTEGILKVKALEQAVRSNEQLTVSSRRSFEAGARTRLDILNAEQQLGVARRDLSDARFTYLVSRARLVALAGGLKAENIDEINGWLQH